MVLTVTATSERSAPAYTFARHETFHIRDGWLFKGMEALSEDPTALHAKDAHHQLGMGINMRKSLVYWIQATGLARARTVERGVIRSLELTDVSTIVREHDPYLEDVGTSWVIHINLATNVRLATLWYWAYNEMPQRDFNEGRLVAHAKGLLHAQPIPVVKESSLKKDANCFLRTYVASGSRHGQGGREEALDCPLASLGLVRQSGTPGMYRFRVGARRNLPIDIFTYTLYRFLEQTSPDLAALSLEDIRWAPQSPGRLLCLDTRAILDYLEQLEATTKHARFIRTAGLNMVALDSEVRSLDILSKYYSQQG